MYKQHVKSRCIICPDAQLHVFSFCDKQIVCIQVNYIYQLKQTPTKDRNYFWC